MAEAKVADERQIRIEFARDLSLFDATMIGVGAMIGAGIFVLTGLAVNQAGPAAVLAFAFNGLVTLLTALSYAELSSTIPEAGGGYAFVRRALSAPVGFLSGWMLWFAYTVACALYARGCGEYFMEVFRHYTPGFYATTLAPLGSAGGAVLVAVTAAVFFVVLNWLGAAVTGKTEDVITVAKIIILGIFALAGLKTIGGDVPTMRANFTPLFPNGFGGVVLAMGLTFVAFEGYDLIATVSEEIKDPEQNIPRAIFLSLGIAVVVYIVVVFVCVGAVPGPIVAEQGYDTAWEFIGAKKEVGLVEAAKSFMGGAGFFLIVVGGVFSTMSALNATVLASSRVCFSMGRDHMLPAVLGDVHRRRRTPHIAILVTGGLILLMAATLPIETVGAGASLLFLLCFALTNLSVIVIRYREPDLRRAFRIPLFPVLPALGTITCIVLAVSQFQSQPMASCVALAWIAVGLIGYFVYFRNIAMPDREVYVVGHHLPSPGRYTVLVPIHNPETVDNLATLGAVLAKANNGEVVLLSIAAVPIQLPIGEGMGLVHGRQQLLEKGQKIVRSMGVEAESVLKISHNAADGILHAAREEECDMIVMGWRGWTGDREKLLGTVLDKVVRDAPCDVAVFKGERDLSDDGIGRMLVNVTASPHADLAVDVGKALAAHWGCSVDHLHVQKTGTEIDPLTVGRYFQADVAKRENPEIEVELMEERSIPATICRRSADYDMVLIGAARQSIVREILFGSKALSVAKLCRSSVLMVKRRLRGPRAWIWRYFLGSRLETSNNDAG
ncbi:MAG: amino acid permease [Armatimonadota bacterium]